MSEETEQQNASNDEKENEQLEEDEESNKVNRFKSFNFSKIDEYANSEEILKYIKYEFTRITKHDAIHLIKLLLIQDRTIRASDINSTPTFFRYNLGKFNKDKNFNSKKPDGELKYELVKKYRDNIIDMAVSSEESISFYEKEKHKNIEVQKKDNEECFVVTKLTDYDSIRRLTCDEGGEVSFKYDFNNIDLPISIPKSSNTLQRCMIQVASIGVKFDYPIEYIYQCDKCGLKTRKLSYLTASSKGKIDCQGRYEYINYRTNEPQVKMCNKSLYPDDEVSLTKDTYYYDINYEDSDGYQQCVSAISFLKLEPGFYECVLFKIKSPKKVEQYHIIDIKTLPPNKFDMPDKVEGENYVLTLIKACDTFIENQTKMKIYGLLPVKAALLIQAVVAVSGKQLGFNLQIIGDTSTGKSLLLKFYGFLLHNNFNILSAGVNISVPGLRGTKQVVTLMGRDYKIITVGLLGTHKTIHIDEAGENRQLVQTLKTFLLEDNYSYDRAGTTGAFRRRTAQVNLSENLDHNHVGQYRGMIRKSYKEDDTQIGEEEKIAWDEEWDVFLPLFKYDNPYLLKIIKDIRLEFAKKQQFWIDGYDIALHERFPFYFYVEKTETSQILLDVIKENVQGNTISENLELIKVLKNNELTKYFNMVNNNMGKINFDGVARVDKIIKEYQIEADARYMGFCYRLVQISAAMNMRKEITEEDYDLLKWFIENTNCKVNINNMITYKVEGPPDIAKQEEMEVMIEDQSVKKDKDVEFGLPQGEFD